MAHIVGTLKGTYEVKGLGWILRNAYRFDVAQLTQKEDDRCVVACWGEPVDGAYTLTYTCEFGSWRIAHRHFLRRVYAHMQVQWKPLREVGFVDLRAPGVAQPYPPLTSKGDRS